jgi:1-acyl-sn-glycerol-3-phosphate acyltransferase
MGMKPDTTPPTCQRGTGRAVLVARLTAAGVVITAGAIVVLPFAAVTLGRARRWYAAWARVLARLALWICGIRLVVHRNRPWPSGQTVYISNHPSTPDLFVLVALGMPNTRFFLSGFLQKYVPLGILARLMGTFFTVPQDRPAERVQIFQRADAELRRTGESVYLSPEGGRVTGGRIGRFNKGSFHLATSLKAPIQPMCFFIPPEIDPGRGFDIRPGAVHVYLKPLIDTRTWQVEDIERNRDNVHEMFVAWNDGIREAHRVPSIDPSLD